MKRPVLFVALQTGARANGGLQSLTEVMLRLKAHRPLVLTNLESGLTQAWRDGGASVHLVPESGASRGALRNLLGTLRSYRAYHRAVRRILAETGARVVHANDPLAFQMSVAAAKSERARIALNLRDTLDPGRKPPARKYRALFAAADHVFYLSQDMAERWAVIAPNAMRASSVTYSIVDPGRFAPSPLPKDDRPAVLVSGIFVPKKGQLDFICNVVPALAAKGVLTRFAGDFDSAASPYAAACEQAAAPYRDHVEFLGYRSDLPELLRASSVVAIPSRHEGLMRGMIEAMAAGRPVVSFDVCSAREVLEDRSGGAGTVIEAGDFAGMAAALLHFASDRDAASAAGTKGAAAARILFEADAVVERYERVYAELDARS